MSYKKYFKFYKKQDVLSITKVRRFETKLGERLQVISDADKLEESLSTSNAKFVLLGIPEDMGVKANGGLGGTHTAWQPFLEVIFKYSKQRFS